MLFIISLDIFFGILIILSLTHESIICVSESTGSNPVNNEIEATSATVPAERNGDNYLQ